MTCCQVSQHEALKGSADYRARTEYVGAIEYDDEHLELRNCQCKSTVSVPFVIVDGLVFRV